VSQKGGTGKSTLCAHLAVEAGGVIVDADPQRSLLKWYQGREASEPVLIEGTAERLPEIQAAAREDDAAWLFVDTAGSVQNSGAVARRCDFVLIPCRPSAFDLSDIGATVEAVREAGTPGTIVINAAPPRRGFTVQSIVTEARDALADYGLSVAPMAISQRADFQYGPIDGRTAGELNPSGKAAEEVRKLWQWLQGEMNTLMGAA
jgi:chromosome partitioning protein